MAVLPEGYEENEVDADDDSSAFFILTEDFMRNDIGMDLKCKYLKKY